MPTTALTVSAVTVEDPAPPGVRHVMRVPLVHDVVPHAAPDTLADWLYCPAPKLNPKIVAEPPPVAAALVGASGVEEMTGAAERAALAET